MTRKDMFLNQIVMYKKATIALSVIFAIILFYFANKFFEAQAYKIVASQKIDYLTSAANNFRIVGIVICCTIWIWINFVVIKTKQLNWLWIPFLFITIVALLVGYQSENIFISTKENGMWEGGFSLSYFVSILIIIFGAFITGIDYIILKKVCKVV